MALRNGGFLCYVDELGWCRNDQETPLIDDNREAQVLSAIRERYSLLPPGSLLLREVE